MLSVELPAMPPAQEQAWQLLTRLDQARVPRVLIGGQMMLLLCAEHQVLLPRPTLDAARTGAREPLGPPPATPRRGIGEGQPHEEAAAIVRGVLDVHHYSCTITYVTTVDFTFSFMLRNSGEVLSAVEHADVRLARRDGSDLIVGTARREAAVRDSLDLAARALGAVLDDPRLAARALGAIESALPWVSWLDPADRRDFAVAFVRTASACHDTENYEPLAKLLNRWHASAQIAHSPELSALLVEPRGDDERVALSRPRT